MIDAVGLAISGGGVRSAAFSLGVLQALNHHNVLRNVDYLSTVSGGGYMGSALTATMTHSNITFRSVMRWAISVCEVWNQKRLMAAALAG